MQRAKILKKFQNGDLIDVKNGETIFWIEGKNYLMIDEPALEKFSIVIQREEAELTIYCKDIQDLTKMWRIIKSEKKELKKIRSTRQHWSIIFDSQFEKYSLKWFMSGLFGYNIKMLNEWVVNEKV